MMLILVEITTSIREMEKMTKISYNHINNKNIYYNDYVVDNFLTDYMNADTIEQYVFDNIEDVGFDQITITLFSYNKSPRNAFAEVFGEPKSICSDGKWGWKFPNNLFLSMYDSKQFYIISFKGNEKVFAKLLPLLKKFKLRWDGRPASMFKSIEIKWDIPFYDHYASKVYIYNILAFLAHHCIPKRNSFLSVNGST